MRSPTAVFCLLFALSTAALLTVSGSAAAPPAQTVAAAPAAPPQRLTVARLAEQAAAIGELLAPPSWPQTPAAIDTRIDVAIAAGNERLDAIAALGDHELTFVNTVQAFELALYPGIDAVDPVDVLVNAHPDAGMRDAALAASKRFYEWSVSVVFRQDVYRKIAAFAATTPALQGEDARLLEQTMRNYRRNGLQLPNQQRVNLERLQKDINNLNRDFQNNINNADVYLKFSAEQLAGAPQDFLNNPAVRGDAGLYRINVNATWQRGVIMRNVRDPGVRRQIAAARFQRAAEKNVPLLHELLDKRMQVAALLGYASWADYQTEIKMAASGARALQFQRELATGLQAKFDAELETLRQLKAVGTGNPEVTLHYWDVNYYENQLKKTRYQIDTEQLKVYFEMDRTLQGMFDIFSELFAISIHRVEPPYKWADELRLYAVSDRDSGSPLGLMYMDLFPRQGKYKHFAHFRVTAGKQLADGRRQRPVSALLCNFPAPTEQLPSLLTYDNVETLFHEFGHAMHSMLSQTRYASFFGTSVERDFVEAPAQMLELWVRDKAVLDHFAQDYRDASRKIPASVLKGLEASRLATNAIFERGQSAMSMIDLRLHTLNYPVRRADIMDISNAMSAEFYLPYPEDTAMVASFGHLAGYDGGYYGYAWARSIAEDLAEPFRNSPQGFMDASIGRRLRAEIYARGGARNAEDSIRAFLGREHSLNPFLRSVGMGQELKKGAVTIKQRNHPSPTP